MKLPQFIKRAVIKNATSLGAHPAFPPDEEEMFLLRALTEYFEMLSGSIPDIDTANMQARLGRMVSDCQKIERGCKEALEKLAIEIVAKQLQMPKDTISIEAKLVSPIDTSTQRIVPEETRDFSFDSIKEMTSLTDEIYKRRMLNALVSGASISDSLDMEAYVTPLFKICPELPSLYAKILRYNTLLMFLEKEGFENKALTEAGKVDVFIASEYQRVLVKAEGIIFPTLLSEAYKGLLELAISHGLPKDRRSAEYVIGKADFKLAEIWDARLGSCLWNKILGAFKSINTNINDIGVNFFLMELSCLSPNNFNEFLKEIFGVTNMGRTMLRDMVDKIKRNKEQDKTNDIIQRQYSQASIMDSGYYTAEDLLQGGK